MFLFWLFLDISYAVAAPCVLVVLDNRKVKLFWRYETCEAQENSLFNNSLITSHFIQNTDFILAQALRYYYFFLSVWSELEQAVPPLLRHLAGILDSQQDPSVRHKKLSSISCSEKLCGFADDLLRRGIQYISSSQTILSNTFIVVKPCSAQLSKLYSRVANKILIRKVLGYSWSGFTYDLSKDQPLKGANVRGRFKKINQSRRHVQKWKHRPPSHSRFLVSFQPTHYVEGCSGYRVFSPSLLCLKGFVAWPPSFVFVHFSVQ